MGDLNKTRHTSNFFKHKIKEVGFVDAEPIKIVPTWKNNKKTRQESQSDLENNYFLRI